MARVTEIREAVEEAAELVATRPVKRWGAWTVYFLERLDEEANTPDACVEFVETLAVLRDVITVRIDLGKW